MSGFQSTVNLYNPPAVEGDFASANPRASVLTPEGGFVAGSQGVRVGRFAWIGEDGVTVNSFGVGSGKPAGFVHRDMQAMIVQYLAESSMRIVPGYMVTLHDEGDFFAIVAGATASTPGAAVYTSFADGSIQFALPAGTTGTGSIGATFTATGSGTNMTVTAVTGYISPNDTISGTGVPAGTVIISQTSGTAGGAGVYVTSAATTATAATVTSFGNVINITAAAGAINIGAPVTGTGVPANNGIASQVSGVPGGVGQYTLDVPATAYAASTALTFVGGIQTNFVAVDAQPVGNLVKITTWGKQ